MTTKSVWPALDLSLAPIGTRQDVIFIASMNPSNVSQYAELCCFLMDTPGMKNFIRPGQARTAKYGRFVHHEDGYRARVGWWME